MNSEIDLINSTEAFFRGELSAEEIKAFEQLRNNDPTADQLVVAHLNLMRQLADMGERKRIKVKLEDIHSELDIPAIRRSVLPSEVIVKRLWAKHRFNLAVAASVALFTLVSTLMFTGYFTDNATRSEYQALRRKLDIKLGEQDKQIKAVANSYNPGKPAEFGGTGFAISSDYLVTNYHVIEGADSVYVQDSGGESYKAKLVYSDLGYDVAVLQIVDPAFKPFNTIPYTIKKSLSDPAEDVFTLGYPGEKQVYNRGYLSSATGYNGDTTSYQASIVVNPGNSGGPLLDNNGNIIGLIKGNQPKAEGVVFATKSNFILKAINDIPAESLDEKIALTRKNQLAGLSRKEQCKKLDRYIFMVKAY